MLTCSFCDRPNECQMTQPLTEFSDTIARLTTAAAPLLAAIRIGPNRHVTGLLCGSDTIVTSDRALPAQDSYTVVLANQALASAHPGPRETGSNLASVRLDSPCPGLNPEVVVAPLGSLAILLGADFDASPTVRLTVIHRFVRTADGPAPVLDLPGVGFEPGAAVLDAGGRLIGLAATGPNGEAMAIPSAVIARLLAPNKTIATPAGPVLPATTGRGWLGVALQPITVPDHLVSRAGQSSGRMVVSTTKGGPADAAGLRVGDVLLALNGTSASGPQALRDFLNTERPGAAVEVTLLRDSNVLVTNLTIGHPPA